MSEKKKNIKDGQDITIDGVTVLNGVSVAEKEEVKEEASAASSEVATEEVPVVEAPEDSAKDETEEPANEIAATEVDSSQVEKEDPFANVDGSIISAPTIELPTEVPASPEFNFASEVPSTPSYDIETNNFDVPLSTSTDDFSTPSYEPQLFNGNNDASSFGTQNNFGGQDLVKAELPDGVKAAVNMIENEAIELSTEIKNLKLKNTELENSNNDLRAQVSELQAQNQILRNEKASIQNSMANVQSRILDVFGASMNNNSIMQNESKVVKFPQSNFNDDQNNNFGGMQNIA